LEKKLDIKTTVFGPKKDHGKELKMLHRLVKCAEEGYEYGADMIHGELIAMSLNLHETDLKVLVLQETILKLTRMMRQSTMLSGPASSRQ
jgi:hypothetical protein